MTVYGITQQTLEVLCNRIGEPVIVVDQEGRLCLLNDAAEAAWEIQAQAVKDLELHDAPALRPLQPLYDALLQKNDTFVADTVTLDSGDQVVVTLVETVTPHDPEAIPSLMEDIVHDLKVPASNAKSLIDVVEAMGGLTEQQVDFVNRARARLLGITNQVNEILDAVWLETGGRIQTEPIDLAALALKTARELKDYAYLQHVTLEFDGLETPCPVCADENRIHHVLANLIGNAIKYSPNGGAVRIALIENGQHVVFEVRDHGIGIPQEELSKIFDRFYRVKSPETRHIEGSGLGLAIVKAIVEKHGGEVFVESKPGEGSTFGFRLPKN